LFLQVGPAVHDRDRYPECIGQMQRPAVVREDNAGAGDYSGQFAKARSPQEVDEPVVLVAYRQPEVTPVTLITDQQRLPACDSGDAERGVPEPAEGVPPGRAACPGSKHEVGLIPAYPFGLQ
jgi:hypothetical protein